MYSVTAKVPQTVTFDELTNAVDGLDKDSDFRNIQIIIAVGDTIVKER